MGLIFNGNGDVIKAVDGSLTVEGIDLGGSTNINAGIVTGTSANFTGAVSVGGVLTYEDVKNVDSVGIVTARGGLNVTANTDTDTLNVSGISTFGGNLDINASIDITGSAVIAGDLDVAADIRHIGDTDTRLRFETDTISARTAGSERVRIDSSGSLLIGGTSSSGATEKLRIENDSATSDVCQVTIISGNAERAILNFGDAQDHNIGRVTYDNTDNHMSLWTNNTERLRIDANGKVVVAAGQLHSSRVLASFGIDCQGMNIYDDVGVVANYGMAFYNDPTTDKANGIGFFNDDGQSCGGYIVHQDKGSGNIGDIVMATSATSNTPVERLRIEKGGNLKQTLTSPSGTSPFQDSHWYDRDGGHYTLSTTDHDSFTAVRTSSGGTYDNLIYKRVKMSKNCDIEFDLSGNSPSGTYRHIGFTLNADGSNANYDRLVFRSRPSSTSSNQIRIDKANGGGYGFQKNGSYIPNFFDGTERHIIIQLRERLVNVLVDGVVIISEKNNADFYNSSGWFGFGIYEGGENAQVTIRNLEIRNKFQRPRWLVRATGVNVDVSQNNPFPYNQVILASSDMNNSSHYNTGSYRFTAPISGLYYVFLRVYRNSSSGSEVAFFVNGSVRNRFRPQPNGGDFIFAGSCLIQLMKDEYIDVRPFNGSFDNFYGNSNQQYSTWGGHLLD